MAGGDMVTANACPHRDPLRGYPALPSGRERERFHKKWLPPATHLDVEAPFSRLDGRRAGDEGVRREKLR